MKTSEKSAASFMVLLFGSESTRHQMETEAMWRYLVKILNEDGAVVLTRGYDNFAAAVKFAKSCANDKFSAGVYSSNQSCLRFIEPVPQDRGA